MTDLGCCTVAALRVSCHALLALPYSLTSLHSIQAKQKVSGNSPEHVAAMQSKARGADLEYTDELQQQTLSSLYASDAVLALHVIKMHRCTLQSTVSSDALSGHAKTA